MNMITLDEFNGVVSSIGGFSYVPCFDYDNNPIVEIQFDGYDHKKHRMRIITEYKKPVAFYICELSRSINKLDSDEHTTENNKLLIKNTMRDIIERLENL